MIEEDILLPHPLLQGVLLHGGDLVVGHGAVVSGEQEPVGHPGLVERDALVQPVPQHDAGGAVLVDPGSGDDDAVEGRLGQRVGREDPLPGDPHHDQVDDTKQDRQSSPHPKKQFYEAFTHLARLLSVFSEYQRDADKMRQTCVQKSE